MKDLVIQIQLERDNRFDCDSVVKKLLSLGLASRLQLGNDDGEYGNIFLQSSDLATLWKTMKPMYSGGSEFSCWLRSVAITTCQGNDGWADYLLLQHFDPAETPDSFL